MATATSIPHAPTPPPGTSEWHAQRRLGIGGSEAAAMFNEGYGCHRRLISDKRGMPDDFVRPEREEAILERGTELEDAVADKFVRETGLKVRRQPARVSKEFPHARVNMDRQIVGVSLEQILELTIDRATGQSFYADYLGDDPGPGVLECKTINEYSLKTLLKQGLANHPDYIFQIQHSLGVTGYKWGIFAFLEPTWWNFLWFPVKRDEPLIAGILQQVEKSWGIVEDVAAPLPEALPKGDKRCKSCLKRKSCLGDKALAEMAGMKEDAGDYVEIKDSDLVQIAIDYRAARAAREQAEEVETAIQDALKAKLGDQTHVSIPEAGVKINWTPLPGSNRWDGKALEGEVNRLHKMQPPGLQHVVKVAEELDREGFTVLASRVINAADSDQKELTKLPVTLAERVENCKKQAAGSRPFKIYAL